MDIVSHHRPSEDEQREVLVAKLITLPAGPVRLSSFPDGIRFRGCRQARQASIKSSYFRAVAAVRHLLYCIAVLYDRRNKPEFFIYFSTWNPQSHAYIAPVGCFKSDRITSGTGHLSLCARVGMLSCHDRGDPEIGSVCVGVGDLKPLATDPKRNRVKSIRG